jgi:hypothetical protein
MSLCMCERNNIERVLNCLLNAKHAINMPPVDGREGESFPVKDYLIVKGEVLGCIETAKKRIEELLG